MKLDTKLLKKLDKAIVKDVIKLVEKIEECDNWDGSEEKIGFVQSAIVAQICMELYNNPTNSVVESDTMKISYKSDKAWIKGRD